MDVIDADGVPMSRESVGLSPRKCLVCDNEARYCRLNDAYENKRAGIAVSHK